MDLRSKLDLYPSLMPTNKEQQERHWPCKILANPRWSFLPSQLLCLLILHFSAQFCANVFFFLTEVRENCISRGDVGTQQQMPAPGRQRASWFGAQRDPSLEVGLTDWHSRYIFSSATGRASSAVPLDQSSSWPGAKWLSMVQRRAVLPAFLTKPAGLSFNRGVSLRGIVTESVKEIEPWMSAGGTGCLKKGISLVDFLVGNWQEGVLTLRQGTGQIDNFGDLHQDTRTHALLTWQMGPLEITQLSAAGTVSSLSASASYTLL